MVAVYHQNVMIVNIKDESTTHVMKSYGQGQVMDRDMFMKLKGELPAHAAEYDRPRVAL